MPGARSHFKVNKRKNPNTGGGCLCSPDAKIQDCVGPFIVATHKEQFVSRNPYIVVGAQCAVRMCEMTGVLPQPAEPAPVVIEASVDADDLDAVLATADVGQLSKALHDKLTAADVGEPVQ